MAPPRSYRDPCGIARALDLVGERWALLVVRELLLGAKRFGELRAGLPGAAPNVLAGRLRELARAGVVRRVRLGPPARAWVYELTPWGRELEPLLLGLGRWGSRAALPARGRELGRDALLLALKTQFDARAAGALRATLAIRLGDDSFRLAIARGRLDVARGAAPDAGASVDTDVATLRAVAFRRRPLAGAIRDGALRIAGDRRLVARVLRLFPPPLLR